MQLRNVDPLIQTCTCTSTCISIFSKLELLDQSKRCTQIYLQIISSCKNLQEKKTTKNLL